MIGNNSSGTRSIIYGKMVDKVIETRNLLTDGNIFHFRELSPEEYDHKTLQNTSEASTLRRFKILLNQIVKRLTVGIPKKVVGLVVTILMNSSIQIVGTYPN